MIKKIKWKNHNILGNLELDFLKTNDSNNSLYNTIILAGENGTGKTTILETLGKFLNLGSIESFEYIEYIIDNITYKIYPNHNPEFAKLGFHIRENKNDGTTQKINSGKNNNPQTIINDQFDIRHFGCVYSKARSGFNTKPIKSTTTQQLDNSKHQEDNYEDFTFIKQLLVDIDAQDSSAFKKECQNDNNMNWQTFEPTAKMHRFKHSFDSFFDKINFNRIDDTLNDEKKILFTKNHCDISIDELSTGEKQIVFRGAYLLKNSNNLDGGIVLIDEPELSMHPKWQKKILQYYRDLFTKNGKQVVQLIIATHSEYILTSALEDQDNVLIISLNEKCGNIESKRIIAPTTLPTITAAETNYIVFGIISKDYHIQLYGYLQHITNKEKIKDCDDYIKSQPQYNREIHEKQYIHCRTTYKTLPTYIRNAIDHPDERTFSEGELKTSIELLIELCQSVTRL